MTSTEFTVGISEGARISSKVLKPPGGGSSDIFGLEDAASNNSSQEKSNDSSTHNRVFGTAELPPPPEKSPPLHQSSIVFEAGSNGIPRPKPRRVFVRRNPITGEETEICLETENDNVCDNEKAKDTEGAAGVPSVPAPTSIRVRNPPGGKSSGIF